MDLSIIIVNWNTSDWLQACLQSILCDLSGQSRLETEIIVVDNDSQDHSVEMLKEGFPEVNLIENFENKGFAAANNQAIQFSSGRNILFLNPDVIVKPGAIQTIVDYLDQHPEAGIVAPMLLNGDGTIQSSASRYPTLFREFWRQFKLDLLVPVSVYPASFYRSRNPQKADVVLGASFLVRKECLDQIGLFDEQFFVYSEEVDLCLRAHRAGWEIHWIPQASMIHYGGKSTNKVSDRMFLELNRNKTRFIRKHQGSFAAQIYKGLLWLSSINRIAVSALAKTCGISDRVIRPDLGFQYSLLIKNIKEF